MLKQIEILQRACRHLLFACAMLASILTGNAQGQTSAFTYQGRLTDGGNPATGVYDFQFKLFDTATVGTGGQQGSTITHLNVDVTNGVFTVELDFGQSVYDGSARYLEIGLRPAGSADPYTVLSPRQPITSLPYALRSATAAVSDLATNATQLAGLTAAGFVQNTTSQQAATNFNIGGTGTANILDAATQFNLDGSRILSNAGFNNLFVGVGSGAGNTTGVNNSFLGVFAGFINSTGSANSFFGAGAGDSNTTGGFNAFFGFLAGGENSTGTSNLFLGNSAGISNTTGNSNTIVGASADVGAGNLSFATAIGSGAVVNTSNTIVLGRSAENVQIPGALDVAIRIGSNTVNATTQYNLSGARILGNTGTDNLFVGVGTGSVNTSFSNSFFGKNAGLNNTTGHQNAFFGRHAGILNTTGDANAFFGSDAGPKNTTGGGNSFFGGGAGFNNAGGGANSFLGFQAGSGNTTGSNNVFVGFGAGDSNTTGQSNTIIGPGADVGAIDLTSATAIGAGAVVNTSNTIVLGTTGQTTRIPGSLIARGNQSESGFPALEVAPSQIGGSVIANNLYIRQFNELGSASPVCWRVSNAGVPALVMTTCSSSARYKTNLEPYFGGLDLILRLQPITFDWKTTTERDVGLIAEEVARVEPLLTFKNSKGEVEGVKYANLSVLFINAFKEQQQQIEQQRQQIDELKRIVCADRPGASICKSN